WPPWGPDNTSPQALPRAKSKVTLRPLVVMVEGPILRPSSPASSPSLGSQRTRVWNRGISTASTTPSQCILPLATSSTAITISREEPHTQSRRLRCCGRGGGFDVPPAVPDPEGRQQQENQSWHARFQWWSESGLCAPGAALARPPG